MELDVQVQEISMPNVLMIGPTKSGKTALVASLRHAALRLDEGWRVISGVGEEAKNTSQLWLEAAKVVNEGKLPFGATTEPKKYSFSIGLPPSILRKRSNETVKYTFLDGPGAGLLPTAVNAETDQLLITRFRSDLIQALRTDVDGLIICVDSTDPDKSLDFFTFLPHLLDQLPDDPLPFKRIAVCMTKSEKYCLQHGYGSDAHRIINEEENPIPLAKDILTTTGLSALKSRSWRSKIRFAWTSSFGFIQSGDFEGEPNCDASSQEDRLRTFRPIDHWQPFQVLEPFLFVGFGKTDGMPKL